MVHVDPTKCIGCNACIRVCPVPTANHYEGGVVHINTDNCIKCGECVKHCLHGARYFDDDLEEVLALAKKQKVSLVVAPAIKSAMDGKWRHVLKWFKDNGINEVYDGSFGADICTYMHVEYLKRNPGKKIISQPCAAIVNYAEKHKPELLPKLSPVQSPLMCTGIYVRKYLHSSDILVGLTPCLAKGDEFINTGVIRYNITFARVTKYLREHNIVLPTGHSEFEFSAQRGFDGAFYPLPGGLKECLYAYDPTLKVTTSEGVQKVYEDFEEYLKTSPSHLPQVYDVLSCEFGCNSGAGAKESFSSFGAYDIMTNARKWAFARKKSERFHKKIFKELKLEDFLRTYTDRSSNIIPSDEELNDVFISMGKITDAERNIDCHACGFKSCKSMALTIFTGDNTPSNCIMYEKKQMQKMKEEIEQQNAALKDATQRIQNQLTLLSEKIDPIAARASDNASKNNDIRREMHSLDDDMENIGSRANEIRGSVTKISISIEEYNKILEKIKSISEETNILAINASIEAASAGEHGKGFAVVAGEVRGLAAKSAETLNEAKEHTNSILGNVSEIMTLSDTIAEDVSNTQSGVVRTNEAVDSLNSSTDIINNSLSDISSVIKEINSIADELIRNA